MALDRKDEARQHFVLARDLDTIQFRTPSSLNRIIREKCAGRTSEGIRLVDAEAAFAGHPKAADGIPGREMFWEHVHLTFDGNHALATAILPQLERVLPAQSVGAAGRCRSVSRSLRSAACLQPHLGARLRDGDSEDAGRAAFLQPI